MGVDLDGTRHSGCHCGTMNGADLEQGDTEIRETFDTSEVPPTVQFEHSHEHGTMIQGVISSTGSRCGKARD